MTDKKKKESSQWDMFHGLWQTAFPLIKGDKVIYWWEKFCNEADWNMLEEAFLILEGQHKTKKKNGIQTYPLKLTDVKDVYYSIRDKKRMIHHDDQGECICCQGAGWVNIVQRLKGNKWVICDPRDVVYAEPEVKMGIFVGPCVCKYGPRGYDYEYKEECVKNRFGSAIEPCDAKMFQYIESCRKAPHTPDMLRQMPEIPVNQQTEPHKALNGYQSDSYPSVVNNVSESLVDVYTPSQGNNYK